MKAGWDLVLRLAKERSRWCSPKNLTPLAVRGPSPIRNWKVPGRGDLIVPGSANNPQNQPYSDICEQPAKSQAPLSPEVIY